MNTPVGKFYSGTSNIVLPVPNKSFFPVEFQNKSRLEFYASLFNSLEINSSFYKIPRAETVERWASSVPEDFKFTFKLWKEITHDKEHRLQPEAIDYFMNVISHAGAKRGCLLVQLPPSFNVNLRYIETMLMQIRKNDPENSWNTAIEFRNRSWYQKDVYAAVRYFGMSVVVHDLPASATPATEQNDDDFVYLRFHGPEGGYRGSYPDEFLYEYAQYIKDWIAAEKAVYVYFNNTVGEAVNNLLTLNSFLEEEDDDF